MRTLLLLAALSGEPPTLPAGRHHVVVTKGDPAPSDGVFADPVVATFDAELREWYENELRVCRDLKTDEVSDAVMAREKWSWVAATAVGIAAGVLIGGWAMYRLEH